MALHFLAKPRRGFDDQLLQDIKKLTYYKDTTGDIYFNWSNIYIIDNSEVVW